jgi:LAS superfamily LD-carboxypeptidase LdcB
VGLALALAVTLGGYTVAESSAQRANVDGLQLQAQAEADARRAAVVAAERQRAVATAEDAIAQAAAVQTVAGPSVAEADLAPLTEAMGRLNALLAQLPETAAAPEPTADPSAATATDPAATDPAATEADAAAGAAADAAATDAPAAVVDREVRASRTSARAAVPTESSATGTAETATPAAPSTPATPAPALEDAVADEAAQVEDGAAADADAPADGGLADATDAPAPADDAAPDDSLAAQILTLVERVTEVAAQVQATADANVAAAQAAAAAKAEADAQAAAAAAAAAAEKAAQRASLDAYGNGQIPAEALCEVPGGHQLRCDAAEAFTALDAAFAAEFGTGLTVSDSYRSYAAQVACVRVKGYLCARPGTSNHGLGVAVDLAGGIQTFGTAQHRWMAENAGQYGWDLPDWASSGGSKPEPWHWEYVG